jgi:S1-C subfamily serine protease
VNLADLVVLILAILAAIRGLARGFLGQLFELGGGLTGLVIGAVLGPKIAASLSDSAGFGAALIALLVVFVCLSLGQALGFAIGNRFGSLARRVKLGPLDSTLGVAFGIVVVLFAYWVIGSLLVHGPFRSVSKQLRSSAVLRLEDRNLPTPPDLFAAVDQYLNTSGFPQVFASLPRPVGPPVRLPPNAIAQRAIRAAQASTVRVVVPACGGTQLGSGWIAASGTVITNAHVVAGGHSGVTVQDAAGSHRGRVVLFDPLIDVAVIKTSGLSGSPLRLDTATHGRGTTGATLGYPGTAGGLQVDRAAAVQSGPFTAEGRDIYGTRQVQRTIYELRAYIRQGDSGGPFVLPNGDVSGMVFAASTLDNKIGYALSGGQIRADVRRGEAATSAVSTRGCTH